MRKRLLWIVFVVGVGLSAGPIPTQAATAPIRTSTALTPSANPGTVGQQVTYTATVTPVPDGGTITFTAAGTAIAGCSAVAVSTSTGAAACEQSYASAGEQAIAASYSGDTNFATSKASLEEAIALATSTAVSSSANPSPTGEQVTYTATVTPTPDAGTVEFSDGGTVISGCSAVRVSAGKAICQQTYASAGSHAIVAAYAGDASYGASQSGSLEQSVGLPKSSTVLAGSGGMQNGEVTYTATVTPVPEGGTVTFTDGGQAIAGCSAIAVNSATGQASCEQTYTAKALHAIVANYSGDSKLAASQSSPLEVGVGTTSTQPRRTVTSVVLPTKTRITKATIGTNSARFSFSAVGATGFQCELLRRGKGAGKARLSFDACRSPRSYEKLGAGSYTFLVRGINKTGPAKTPARRKFAIG